MISNLAAGLVVTVKDKATGVLRTIGQGFEKLKDAGTKLKDGLSQIGQGFMTFAKGGAIVAAALAFMGYQAANFEQQMSAVRAVMQGVTDAEFSTLEKEIKRLGATTSFSATQAAEGAELLARAGFSASESVGALAGVLNAAAAEGIPMATAANIIANNVRAFGLEAADATRVADVLALTSAKTNTSMIDLGEGLKYVASTAFQLRVPLEDTAMALGLLANAGLQGSIGGTALNTMMLSLGNVSDENKKKLNEFGIQIQDVNGDMLPLVQIIENFAGGLKKIDGNLNQTAFLMDMFGIRGQKAAGNLAMAFDKMSVPVENGKNAFENLRDAINNADGAAGRMAAERLNNLRGAFTLLWSAIEGVSIELMLPLLKEATGSTLMLTDAVSALASGMQAVDDVLAGRYVPEMREGSKMTKETALSLAEFGAGLALAAKDVAAFIRWANEARDALVATWGGQSDGMIGIGRMAGLMVFAAAAGGTLATVIGVALLPVVGALMISFEGVFAVASLMIAMIPPIAIGFALLAGYIGATTREGQSFGDRFLEVVTGAWSASSAFFLGFYDGFTKYIKPATDGILAALLVAWEGMEPAFNAIDKAFGGTAKEARSAGETIGAVLGWIANLLLLPAYIVSNVLAPAFGAFIGNFVAPMIESVGLLSQGLKGLLTGTMTFEQAFISMGKGIAGVMLNTVLLPAKMVIIAIMETAAAIGAVSERSLANVKGFLNMEEGSFLGRDADRTDTAAARALAEAHAAKTNALETGYRDREQAMTGTVNTTVEGCINTDVKVSGRNLSIAKSEHEFELSQRGGFTLNPFQQGPIIANGGLPAGATG